MASVPWRVVLAGIFSDFAISHTPDPLRPAHHPPRVCVWLGVSPLRRQNAAPSVGGLRGAGSRHLHYFHSDLGLIPAAREGSLLPPVFLHSSRCCRHCSYAFARSLVDKGHQVQMVCLRDARTHTGLRGPFTAGRRSGLVDGIEVIEFDLAYSNHAGLLKRVGLFAI